MEVFWFVDCSEVAFHRFCLLANSKAVVTQNTSTPLPPSSCTAGGGGWTGATFGIVQGGLEVEMRLKSLEQINGLSPREFEAGQCVRPE